MADRKTEILEATCRVIAREGADGLRMGTVAREAGVSSALLHYYFDTRADLLMQAFEHADVKADEAAEQAITGIPSALGRLQRLLLIYAGADAVFRDDWLLWVEMWRSSIFDERRDSTTARFSSPGRAKMRCTPSFSSAATRTSDPLVRMLHLPVV